MSVRYLLCSLPLGLIFGSSLVNPNQISKAGTSVPARPDPIVFGIAWTIIVALITYDLYIVLKRHPKTWFKVSKIYLIIATCILCGLWNIIYLQPNGNKNKSTIIIMLLILCMALILNNISVSSNTFHKYLRNYDYTTGAAVANYVYTPLIAWIIVAINLNICEINNLSTTTTSTTL